MSKDIIDSIDNLTNRGDGEGRALAWITEARQLLLKVKQLLNGRANLEAMLNDMGRDKFGSAIRFSQRAFGGDIRSRSTRNFKAYAVDPDTMRLLLTKDGTSSAVVNYLVFEVGTSTGEEWLKNADKNGCSTRGRVGHKWTDKDCEYALELHDRGWSAQEIAKELGRTEGAAGNKLDALLRQRDENKNRPVITAKTPGGAHDDSCMRCGGTGVVETGNNDRPCDCDAGDKAIFNVAGRGAVLGHQLKAEQHYRRWETRGK